VSGEKQEPNFAFLKIGTTAKEEVEKNLVFIDTHAKDPGFFWGRWETSKWTKAVVVGPYINDRIWDIQNVLIAFDEKGVVKSWKIVKDKELFKEIDLIESTPRTAIDLSSPLHLEAIGPSYGQPSNPRADLILSSDSLIFGARRAVKAPRESVIAISSAAEDRPQADLMAHTLPDPAHVWIVIHFAKSKKGAKSLACGMEPSAVLILRKYVAENNKT
jgi:hypothetical protein